MKKTYIFALLCTLGVFTACSKKEEATPTNDAHLTTDINGTQQRPNPNMSTATGRFEGDYVASSRQLTYTVTYTGLTPTSAHIHTGPPEGTGAISIPFASLVSPITGTFTLSATQADDLLSNRMYVNIHTAAYGGGEIRGNIHK